MTVITFAPAPPSLDLLPGGSGQFALQLDGQSGSSYALQTSSDLVNWTSISTNILTAASMTITNTVPPGAPASFWRAVWLP